MCVWALVRHEPLSDADRFVGEGDFSLNGEKDRHYFLFNDMLIFAKWKPNKGIYHFKNSMQLYNLVVQVLGLAS